MSDYSILIPMNERSHWICSDDGAKLFVRQWKSGDTRGIVHLVHGMAEHSARYAGLAEKLAAEGFDLWAADQRGHGKTADTNINNAGSGGLLGHTSDKNGFFRVVRDIPVINSHIRNTSPAHLPLFIMGHSWGSFLVQGFIETLGASIQGTGISGAVLSGTRGPGGADLVFGAPFLVILAALTGTRRPSKLACSLSLGSYNKTFRPNRTAFDWLSRDEKAVDAYAADPLCGQLCSAGFFRDLAGGLKAIHRADAIHNIPADLPVYVFCGNADPAGEMGTGPAKLVGAYRECGIQDLELVLYPDARHETLNETNREEVCEGLVNWLRRHI